MIIREKRWNYTRTVVDDDDDDGYDDNDFFPISKQIQSQNSFFFLIL